MAKIDRLRELLRIDSDARSGLARQVRECACLEPGQIADPAALLAAFDIDARPGVPSNCDAITAPEETDDARVRLNMRGTPARVSERLGHEVTHLCIVLSGGAAPHEELSVDRLDAAVRLDETAARAILAARGWDGERLAAWAAERNLPARHVLGRVAEVGGGVAIIVERLTKRTRTVWAPEHITPIVATEGTTTEAEWWALAYQGTHRVGLWPGLGVWAYCCPTGAVGTVALIEPEAWGVWGPTALRAVSGSTPHTRKSAKIRLEDKIDDLFRIRT